MAISRLSLDSIPTSFATVSCGTPNDPLTEKLEAIAAAGFQAIELGFPDLLNFASTYHKKDIKEDDYENICSAGVEVRKLCASNNLGLMMLQPFANFEGWSKGSKEREDAFSRAQGWISIMEAVGTDMLQVMFHILLKLFSSTDMVDLPRSAPLMPLTLHLLSTN